MGADPRSKGAFFSIRVGKRQAKFGQSANAMLKSKRESCERKLASGNKEKIYKKAHIIFKVDNAA